MPADSSKPPPLTRLLVSGCFGRMGTLVRECALEEPGRFRLVGGVVREGDRRDLPGTPEARIAVRLEPLAKEADLLIEFAPAAAALAHAQEAAHLKLPMVIGTTGFTPDQQAALRKLSRRIPIFWSPNMSVGVVIVRRAIHAISKLLFEFGMGERTRASISETHHARKKDKPSGTAKALAEELTRAAGWLIRDEEIEARREGDVVGLHSVTFHCPAEKIILTHEAIDRRIFAEGALLVAQNFKRLFRKPGWYTMDNLLDAIQGSGSLGTPNHRNHPKSA